ncbi:DUF4065 domain-containing protein [Halobacillus fulvus]|nr:DUF4065 domain-containing protein [Halobacillus fulvus]
MANALNVARFLLYLAQRDDQISDLSNLKLQKLLYYAQLTNFQRKNSALFEDSLEAWQFGPVVRSVYEHFKSHGSRPIKHEFNPDDVQHLIKNISREEAEVILETWNNYKNKSAWELVEASHNEKPWRESWFNNQKIIDEDLLTSRT